MPFEAAYNSDIPNISRTTVNSDGLRPHDGLMYGAKRPDSFIFEKGKDTPMDRFSVASKTLREASIKKKPFLRWPTTRKKEQAREIAILEEQTRMEEREERQRLQRQLEEQKGEMERLRAASERRDAETQRLAEEARQVEQAKRDTARRERDMEITAQAERLRAAEHKRRANTTDALRNLRELIRTRYELDMEIYRMRTVRGPDRPLVLQKMQRSDAVLAEILAIVSTWEPDAETWDKKEWELAQDVRNRLLADNKRHWKNNPPWMDD